MHTQAEIRLQVDLNEQHIPVGMRWLSTDSPDADWQNCHSFMLTLFDIQQQRCAGIDLWTQDTGVDDMNCCCYQALLRLSDTLQQSTGNVGAAELLRQCASEFLQQIQHEGGNVSTDKSDE